MTTDKSAPAAIMSQGYLARPTGGAFKAAPAAEWPTEEQPDGTVIPVDPADRQQRGGDVDENGLLPCPFCGAKAFATYKTDDYDGVRKYSVHCHAQCGGKIHGRHYSEADAIAAWNARAALAPQPAASAEPVAWLVDWPNEPELGHYFAETPAEGARNRALVLQDTLPMAAHKPDGGDAKDAERYRWLRAHFRFAADSDCEIWFDSSLKHSPADQLDSAIDAAMAQQRQGIVGYDPLEGMGDGGPHEARLLKQRQEGK